MIDNVWQAGEYNVLEAYWMLAGGETIDVKQQVENIIVYEDLYKPFTTATVMLLDTYDLPGKVGQFSRDLFKLKLETPGMPANTRIDLVFFVNSIDRREMRNDRLQGYCLNLVQQEYTNNLHRSISKTFTGTGDSIVQKMVQEYMLSDLPVIVEGSSKQIKYTSNFWSPIKNIEYCKQHSINGRGVPLYFFYNNREGFNFASLDKLTRQKPYTKFNGSDFLSEVDFKEGTPAFGEAKRSPKKDWEVVQGLEWERHNEYTLLHQAGGIKSDLITHDLLTKKYKNIRFLGNTDPRTKMNPNWGYTADVYSTAGPVRITASKYYDNHDMKDVTNTKFIQKFQAEFADILQYKIQIDVLGRMDYTVGQKVTLNMNRPIVIDKSGKDITDYLLSGDYIITSIAHQCSRGGHLCTMELSKESTRATR